MNTRYDLEFKAHAVKEWLSSPIDMPMTTYCEMVGISPRSLRRWINDPDVVVSWDNSNPTEHIDTIDVIDDEEVGDEEYQLIGTGAFVTIYRGAEQRSISREQDSALYSLIMTHWANGEHELAWEASDIKKSITECSHGHIKFVDGEVFYRDWKVNGSFVDYMVACAKACDEEGLMRWCKFAEKLMDQRDSSIVNDIADWMKVNGILLDDDGDMIAHKGVRDDLWDCYTSKTFYHSDGAVLSMPRNLVEHDRNITCAAGIHFGSLRYASSWGSVVVKVKINPADVCSIPEQYGFHKGRCCRATVIGKI